MNQLSFIKEVKAAVSGGIFKKRRPKKKPETAEEICLDELDKPKPKGLYS